MIPYSLRSSGIIAIVNLKLSVVLLPLVRSTKGSECQRRLAAEVGRNCSASFYLL